MNLALAAFVAWVPIGSKRYWAKLALAISFYFVWIQFFGYFQRDKAPDNWIQYIVIAAGCVVTALLMRPIVRAFQEKKSLTSETVENAPNP